ncbi:hypothetical protein F444_09003 [Phytophthora nicotianae P1976]|uniref:ATP-dependent DNA helicase n=1 Tax=Phytophthora nicotianae P1976 TaxID=1317066 RepID=A0A081A939_PHYNI|nr:hypothetical protein F444_09003 [Phytophthora nicotianae P1976]
MAALFLLRGSPFYSSCSFVKLFLGSILKVCFEHEAIDVVLSPVQSGTSYLPSSPLLDYTMRATALESTCLYDFTREWVKKKGTKGLKFWVDHTQYLTYSMYRRKSAVVVTIVGYQFPDNREDRLCGDQLIRFQRALLLLFLPFRDKTDLQPPTQSLDEFYNSWFRSAASEHARIFLEYALDYYASRELASTRTDLDKLRYSEYVDAEEVNESCDCDDNHEETERELCSVSPGVDDVIPQTVHSVITNVSLLPKAIQAASLAAQSTDVLRVSIDPPSLTGDQVDRIIGTTIGTTPLDSKDGEPRNRIAVSLPTRVDLLRCAWTSQEWIDPSTLDESTVPPSVGANASIQEVAAYYRLNRKQHKMFACAGCHLLKSLAQDSVPGNKQFIGFIGGLPGAGKSQVIKALQKLAASWESSDSLGTAAYQGVAAQAANGQTLHKFFGWGIHSRKKKPSYSFSQRERFAKLKMLIIDEISTMDSRFLGMADAALRDLKGAPDSLFGGVHVLFVGDWLQQLPVAGCPAFSVPDPGRDVNKMKHSDATHYLERIRGNTVYKAVNYVVILDENMRHRDDPQWRDILNRWRVGNYLSSDIDIVNAMCYRKKWSEHQNVSTVFKLANGTIGYVVSIKPSSTDIEQVIQVGGFVTRVHSEPPEIIFVQLRDHNNPLFEGLPDGVVPLRPWKQNSIQIQLPDRSFSVNITQIPLVPAFSLTSEKCQGLTVERMILAPLRHSTRKSPQRSYFYVAVTRVTTMSELILTEELTLEYLSYFIPDPEALAETERLLRLELALL